MLSIEKLTKPRTRGKGQAGRANVVINALPVLVPLLLMAITRVQYAEEPSWLLFLDETGKVLLAGIPLFIAHFAAIRLTSALALPAWVACAVGIPIVIAMIGFAPLMLAFREWAVVAPASAIALVFDRRSRGGLAGFLQRLPVTLDGTVLALLAVWTLAMTSLFNSTPDPVNNQPLGVFFDVGRIIGDPVMALGYLVQFAGISALIYALFWLCRYWLVRRVLSDHGWPSFFFAAGLLWAFAVPVCSSLVLLMPLNTAEWTLLPSEDGNVFAGINYRVGFAFCAVFILITLASERLLEERSEALTRYAQVRSEFDFLREQINPHFMFNTLNTLYSLCLNDQKTSAQAIVKLSDLLRYSVYETRDQWVPIRGEIDHLRNYLDLQMLRFENRCDIDTEWPADGGELLVPPQAMIMLVENAFKHGVENSDGRSHVAISLSIEGTHMRFECVNSLGAVSAGVTGIGLANLRRRLELLLGHDFTLLSEQDGQDWRAMIELELRPC